MLALPDIETQGDLGDLRGSLVTGTEAKTADLAAAKDLKVW